MVSVESEPAHEDRNDALNSAEVDRHIWVKDRILTCNFYSCNFNRMKQQSLATASPESAWPLQLLIPRGTSRCADR